ncbi:MAG: hypothetical protein PHV11_06390 [Candidatus Bipolaricaulis sp.]|jgi:hypothetical protein|nr:hypothetical protein [Candidatus Bipolaricaulis sp.]
MISAKSLKSKRVMFTTHNRGMRRLAARIEAKPVDQRSPEERRTLAGIIDEEKGIRTISDVREERIEKAKAAAAAPAPQEVKAEPKAKKAAASGGKSGKKKK